MTLALLLGCTPDTGFQVVAEVPTAPTEWEPGDPIAGWPTFDCSEGERGDVVEVAAGTVIRRPILSFGPRDLYLPLRFADCLSSECTSDLQAEPALIELKASIGIDGASYQANSEVGPPLGWVRTMRETSAGVDVLNNAWFLAWAYSPPLWYWAAASSPGFYLYDDSWAHYGGDVCLAEIRPDRLRAVVRFALPSDELSRDYTATWLIRQPAILRYRIDLPLPSPCDDEEIDVRYPADYADTGSQRATELEIYDTVWPWDSIEDPAIRDRLYELYKPECD